MITYKYTALSRDGAKVTGIVDGFNELDAVDRIKQSCDVVLKLTEVKNDKLGILNNELGGNKLNVKAFTLMCSQFAIILKAGVPIARTVKLIADKTSNKPLKKILENAAEDVEAGRSLATSLSERGHKILPPIFIETVRAGEASGNIDKAFESMAAHYDKEIKIRSKVKSALSYPIFVLAIAVVVVIVLMVKVVPTFIAIFAEYGAELPFMTQLLINISNFFRHYYLLMIFIIAVCYIAFKLYSNTETGRMNLAKLQLKLPIFGNIAELSAASQFSNTMATMLGSGLIMTRAVSITSKVIDNYYISEEIGKIVAELESGHSLGGSLRAAQCMPDILVDMTAVGEETGEIDQTLNTIAAYYDAELDEAIKSALAKLEPSILIGLALIAGFIVIAIYMAMFEMYGVM